MGLGAALPSATSHRLLAVIVIALLATGAWRIARRPRKIVVRQNAPFECENLMIVAHPDEETIWVNCESAHASDCRSQGGETLLSAPRTSAATCWKVLLITGGHSTPRKDEFAAAQTLLKADYEIWTNDDCLACEVEKQISGQLDELLNHFPWARVVTHNPQGEYYHRQHVALSREVTRLLRNKQALHYFGPLSLPGSWSCVVCQIRCQSSARDRRR